MSHCQVSNDRSVMTSDMWTELTRRARVDVPLLWNEAKRHLEGRNYLTERHAGLMERVLRMLGEQQIDDASAPESPWHVTMADAGTGMAIMRAKQATLALETLSEPAARPSGPLSARSSTESSTANSADKDAQAEDQAVKGSRDLVGAIGHSLEALPLLDSSDYSIVIDNIPAALSMDDVKGTLLAPYRHRSAQHIGNARVIVKFHDRDEAARAHRDLDGQVHGGQRIRVHAYYSRPYGTSLWAQEVRQREQETWRLRQHSSHEERIDDLAWQQHAKANPDAQDADLPSPTSVQPGELPGDAF